MTRRDEPTRRLTLHFEPMGERAIRAVILDDEGCPLLVVAHVVTNLLCGPVPEAAIATWADSVRAIVGDDVVRFREQQTREQKPHRKETPS